MPIFSLDSEYGIGTLGAPAKAFVDFICHSRGNLWQVLPLGPTGYGNSPYQCFSAFAGNPLFIDPDWLYQKGWITKNELNAFCIPNNGRVNYDLLHATRHKLLYKSYLNFKKLSTKSDQMSFDGFCRKNDYWLSDYTTFMSLKNHFGMVGRENFDDFKLKSDKALAFVNRELSDKRDFYAFLEYVFFAQWQELKEYAKQKGVKLIGDIPLYISNDSADVWSAPDLFLLNDSGAPTHVAGVPPDIFSKEGQLWGNPLYRWKTHEQSGFDWWKKRIAYQAELFDIIRIDHFIGISGYYSISANAENAKNGQWHEGPGKKLTNAFASCCDAKFIAEDLGVVTNRVRRLINSTGFPGMRIMQFAFDGEDNPNLTHNIPQNCVVYPGTHDNQTLRGFFTSCKIKTRKNAILYLDIKRSRDLPDAVIRECFRSSANTAIIPFWDYVGLDDEARINTPSTLGNNWVWRYNGNLNGVLADKIATLAAIYKREN